MVISFLEYDYKLIQEANRINEIIEVQKESFDLPKLNIDKSNANNESDVVIASICKFIF